MNGYALSVAYQNAFLRGQIINRFGYSACELASLSARILRCHPLSGGFAEAKWQAFFIPKGIRPFPVEKNVLQLVG
jgi:hypothetical protein